MYYALLPRTAALLRTLPYALALVVVLVVGVVVLLPSTVVLRSH